MKASSYFIAVMSGFVLSASVFASNDLNIGSFDPGAGTSPKTQNTEGGLAKEAGIRNAGQLLHAAHNPIGGNPNGNVSLVEFLDYQCRHCADMNPTIRALISSNPNLRVVYKEFPIRGSISDYAAKAAIAANLQGKFSAFHDALMQSSSSLSNDKILEIATQNGLDIAKLKADMNSDTVTSQLAENNRLAQSMGINGTPAFFISKTSHPTNATSELILGEVDQNYLQGIISKINS